MRAWPSPAGEGARFTPARISGRSLPCSEDFTQMETLVFSSRKGSSVAKMMKKQTPKVACTLAGG